VYSLHFRITDYYVSLYRGCHEFEKNMTRFVACAFLPRSFQLQEKYFPQCAYGRLIIFVLYHLSMTIFFSFLNMSSCVKQIFPFFFSRLAATDPELTCEYVNCFRQMVGLAGYRPIARPLSIQDNTTTQHRRRCHSSTFIHAQSWELFLFFPSK